MKNEEETHKGGSDSNYVDKKEEDPTRGYLNKGEEDEMEVEGYRSCLLYKCITYVLMVATLGLLRLAFHWWPKLGLYCTHRPAPLPAAQKLLVKDTYEKRFNSLFAKDVKIIYPCDKRKLDKSKKNGIKMVETPCEKIRVHLDDGSVRDMNEIRAVWIKKLCYIWVPEVNSFLKVVGLDNSVSKAYLHEMNGFTEHEQNKKRTAYGANEISVPIQSIATLIMLEVLNPFYIFQVFAVCVWLADEYYYYSLAILIMSLFGIGSAVIQTHSNQKRLRATIHSTDIVTVKRDKVYEDIPTTLLVPGDIIVIPTHGCTIYCDAVLLNGSCIVNESMLTGESVPVTKTALPKNDTKYNPIEDTNHTLFCGTQVIQTRYYSYEKVHAVVIRTGYLTAKGSLVRSILYPPPADFKFDEDSYKFIWVLATIGFIGCIYTFCSKISRGINFADVVVKVFDLLTIIIPPALPGAMTVGKIYALSRLKKENISCINSRVINVSGSINCVCFDKTGTLTEDGLDMRGVLAVRDGVFSDLTLVPQEANHEYLLHGMATCHSLTVIDGNITGDPLDLKMFESTRWSLNEPSLPDDQKYDLLIPHVVISPKLPDQDNTEIGVLYQHQFSSRLQRMSVITRELGKQEIVVYCKGSPETILSLCNQSTVPEDSLKKLKEYTKQGYRVLALGWKCLHNIPYHKFNKMLREEVETDLTLAGFIVLENRLKKETIPTIGELKNANIKIVMITGDNIQTAMSVAKEAGIIEPYDTTVEIHINNEKIPELEYHVVNNEESNNKHNFRQMNGNIEKGLSLGNIKLATTGKTWSVIRDKIPELLPRLITQGAVFARMTSDQKQQLIVELQKMGYFVAMCGDGANDCGALKAAHVGISLSEAESSVASPFTSREANISCVPKVIREGRAALATSFGVFKFMVLYSFTEFFSTLNLYRIDSNITDFQFLFIDVALIVNFAFFFGRSKAYRGPIVPETPLSSMLHLIPIVSLVLQILTMVVIQLCTYYIVQQFSWFEPFHYQFHKIYNSYENYAVYTVSQFQYITYAVVFSQGPPYREPIYKNTIFFTSIIVVTALCVYITVCPAQWIIDLLQLRFPPSLNFPFIVLVLGFLHFLICTFLEDFVVNYVLFKRLSLGVNNSDKAYLKLEKDYQEAEWPPSTKRYSILQKSPSIDFTSTDVIVTKL